MMIDGLKLTFTGDELRRLLEARIASHNMSADRWRSEESRTPESETEDAPLLPDHICEHETERHEWRASVLEFIRSHIEQQATYCLGAADPTNPSKQVALSFQRGHGSPRGRNPSTSMIAFAD